MFVVVPKTGFYCVKGRTLQQTCLVFVYSDSEVASPSLWCASTVPQVTGQRFVNSTIQKGKWDGMCYSYTLSVTKYSTSGFFLLVFTA